MSRGAWPRSVGLGTLACGFDETHTARPRPRVKRPSGQTGRNVMQLPFDLLIGAHDHSRPRVLLDARAATP